MDYTDEIKSDRHPILTKAIGVLQHIKEMILAEIRHRLNQVNQLGIFPASIKKISNIISQTYVGSITIWP